MQSIGKQAIIVNIEKLKATKKNALTSKQTSGGHLCHWQILRRAEGSVAR
jgi:hypothetical protein